MFSASAVFPIEGRAARMMSSPSCMPAVISSNLSNPVLMPLIRLLGSRKTLMPPSKLARICSVLTSVSLSAAFAELEDGFFRAGKDLFGLFLPDDAAVDQLLRREDDAPQRRLVLDDLDVAVEREDLRQAVVERDEVAESVDRLELVLLHQLIGDGYAVDALAAFGQIAHAEEDTPVLLEREVLDVEKPATWTKLLSSSRIAPSTNFSASMLEGSPFSRAMSEAAMLERLMYRYNPCTATEITLAACCGYAVQKHRFNHRFAASCKSIANTRATFCFAEICTRNPQLLF